jgi:hypothetical protein
MHLRPQQPVQLAPREKDTNGEVPTTPTHINTKREKPKVSSTMQIVFVAEPGLKGSLKTDGSHMMDTESKCSNQPI